MLNFQDLPDELVLKVLSYSQTKDLINCGQVSKRIRRISRDGTLWVTANLEKKIVKTELLEMILQKGCKILNICHSTILGRLSSKINSQLSVLNLSQPVPWTGEENIGVFEELLFSCCSLKHLVMEGAFLTSKMAVSICKNGKTLEILNLNSSDLEDLTYDGLDGTPAYHYLQEIITCCQELKEVDLGYVNNNEGLVYDDLAFLTENISPNIEKLNLSSSYMIMDFRVKILLERCNKIKALSLAATSITDDSLEIIKQHLNLTLEELSFEPIGGFDFSLSGFLELEFMPRLKILNLYDKNDDDVHFYVEVIQILKQNLPHLMIKGAKLAPFAH